MKFVVKNPYHLWAHQSQSRAHNASRNRSFDGVSAYSYRAEIGRVVYNAKGERAYLLAGRDWTVTTNRHQSELARAIESGSTVFHVSPSHSHTDAVWSYTNRLITLQGEYKRARSNKPYKAIQLADLYKELQDYIAFFEVTGVDLPTFENLDELAEQVEVERKKAAQEAKEQEAQRLQEAQDKIARWIAGENVYLPYFVNAYMRVVGNEVETSQGAIVPLADVCKACKLVLRLVNSGAVYSYTVHGAVAFGSFALRRIDENGTVTVGCHTFARAEIERFAKVLETVCP